MRLLEITVIKAPKEHRGGCHGEWHMWWGRGGGLQGPRSEILF